MRIYQEKLKDKYTKTDKTKSSWKSNMQIVNWQKFKKIESDIHLKTHDSMHLTIK